MWKTVQFKVTAIFALVCCCVWLSTTLIPKYRRRARGVHLLSFIPVDLSSLQSPPWNQPSRRYHSSPMLKSPSAASFQDPSYKIRLANRINDSLPWLHYYASSSKILENYFFHGYHQGIDKYLKRYTNSHLAILPFFSDRDDLLRNCLHRVSVHKGVSVSPQKTLSDRWHWETSTEGLAKFKEKFQLFYGHASMGMCLQNVQRAATTTMSDIDKENRHPGGSSADDKAFDDKVGKKLVQKMKKHNQNLPGGTFTFQTETSNSVRDSLRKKDSMNCGQVLLLQHPISKAIEDYYETVSQEHQCDEKVSVNKYNSDEEDKDVANDDNGDDDSRIVTWIKHRGNVIFKHLVFNSELCSQDFFLKYSMRNKSQIMEEKNQTNTHTTHSYADLTTRSGNFSDSSSVTKKSIEIDESDRDRTKFKENSCDRNMRLFSKELDTDEKNFLVNHITESLPFWFSMVGLYEDLQKSLQMLDVVHHLPLQSCIQKQSEDTGSPLLSNTNHNNRKHENNARRLFSFQEPNIETNDRGSAHKSSEAINNDFLTFESDLTKKSLDANNKRFSNYQDTFQDLKDGIDTNDIGEEMSTKKQFSHRSKIRSCNEASSSFQGMFNKLNENEAVRKSLALDLKIYKAVKQLYQYQKQIVFNTLKA